MTFTIDAGDPLLLGALVEPDVLIWYDGPRLFAARDPRRRWWIAVNCAADPGREHWLYACPPTGVFGRVLDGRLPHRAAYERGAYCVTFRVPAWTFVGGSWHMPVPEDWLPSPDARLDAAQHATPTAASAVTPRRFR